MLIALSVFVALGLLAAATSAPAEAKMKQPGCGKLQKKVKKSKGKAKKRAKKALKLCKKARVVQRQIKDSRFQGERSDGIKHDTVFCANGQFQVFVVEGGPAENGGWKVKLLRFRSTKKFTAAVIGKVPGGTYEIGLQRNGDKWKIGRVSFDQVSLLGPAVKSNGKAICASF